jgi:hypothetical protein
LEGAKLELGQSFSFLISVITHKIPTPGMRSETVTIKALNGTAVYCQIGGCGRPALHGSLLAQRRDPHKLREFTI